jgi:hypothetical protein
MYGAMRLRWLGCLVAALGVGVLHACPSRGSDLPPRCKVFLSIKITGDDVVGGVFVEQLRSQLSSTHEVVLTTTEDDANLVARVGTMRNGPHETIVTVVLALHRMISGTSNDLDEKPGPQAIDVLMQGPELGTYPEATVKEGAARYVYWITDPRMLAACVRFGQVGEHGTR